VIEDVRVPERIRLRPENRRYQVSRLSGTVFLALFLTGLAGGAVGRLLLRTGGELR